MEAATARGKGPFRACRGGVRRGAGAARGGARALHRARLRHRYDAARRGGVAAAGGRRVAGVSRQPAHSRSGAGRSRPRRSRGEGDCAAVSGRAVPPGSRRGPRRHGPGLQGLQEGIGRHVAIKLLPPAVEHGLPSPLSGRTAHPGRARASRAGPPVRRWNDRSGHPYLVMEYIEGRSPRLLQRQSARVPRSAEPLHARLRGRAVRAPASGRPPRSQAVEHPGHRRRAIPSCSTSASPSCCPTTQRPHSGRP